MTSAIERARAFVRTDKWCDAEGIKQEEEAIAALLTDIRLEEAKWWHNCPNDHKCADYPERESCQHILALEAERRKAGGTR